MAKRNMKQWFGWTPPPPPTTSEESGASSWLSLALQSVEDRLDRNLDLFFRRANTTTPVLSRTDSHQSIVNPSLGLEVLRNNLDQADREFHALNRSSPKQGSHYGKPQRQRDAFDVVDAFQRPLEENPQFGGTSQSTTGGKPPRRSLTSVLRQTLERAEEDLDQSLEFLRKLDGHKMPLDDDCSLRTFSSHATEGDLGSLQRDLEQAERDYSTLEQGTCMSSTFQGGPAGFSNSSHEGVLLQGKVIEDDLASVLTLDDDDGGVVFSQLVSQTDDHDDALDIVDETHTVLEVKQESKSTFGSFVNGSAGPNNLKQFHSPRSVAEMIDFSGNLSNEEWEELPPAAIQTDCQGPSVSLMGGVPSSDLDLMDEKTDGKVQAERQETKSRVKQKRVSTLLLVIVAFVMCAALSQSRRSSGEQNGKNGDEVLQGRPVAVKFPNPFMTSTCRDANLTEMEDFVLTRREESTFQMQQRMISNMSLVDRSSHERTPKTILNHSRQDQTVPRKHSQTSMKQDAKRDQETSLESSLKAKVVLISDPQLHWKFVIPASFFLRGVQCDLGDTKAVGHFKCSSPWSCLASPSCWEQLPQKIPLLWNKLFRCK